MMTLGMLSPLSYGYLFEFLLLVALLYLCFGIYLVLLKYFNKPTLFGPIAISISILYVFAETIGFVFGLFFSGLAIFISFSLLVMILCHLFIVRFVNGRLFKVVGTIICCILVGVILYIFVRNRYPSYFNVYYPPSDAFYCVEGIGSPCAVIEDKGKVTASKTVEARELMKKHGREHVQFRALEIHLAHDHEFIRQLYPAYTKEIGCIIVVEAGDEGYVMFEKENLEVVEIVTLEQFREATRHVDPRILEQFSTSLH